MSSSSGRDAMPRTRSTFVRDVLLLQWKLLLGNVHNIILIPLTLVAAALDLVFRSGEHGSRFYRVLDWGRQVEDIIGLYRALDVAESRTDRRAMEPHAKAGSESAMTASQLARPQEEGR